MNLNSQRLVAVDGIKPNPLNARTHSKKQIRQIADSIRAFGFVAPVLIDENGVLIAGHGRLEAARLLGLKTVPAIVIEGLTGAKKRALLLADNRIALVADAIKDCTRRNHIVLDTFCGSGTTILAAERVGRRA